MTSATQADPLFSIIIPAYNAAAYVGFALDSVFNQSLATDYYEVILVDDRSTDHTKLVVSPYQERPNFVLASTTRNSGPGVARNVGIDLATGRWVIFLDSDDRLMPNALLELQEEIAKGTEEGAEFDAVGLNWGYVESNQGADIPTQSMRRDHVYLNAGRDVLLQRYLSLQMDGSVIYTAIRHSLLRKYQLRFDSGIHEDVDFLFYIYWYARGVRFVNRILYGKVRRQDSIVNTMAERHVDGFMRAWRAIGRFLLQSGDSRREALKAHFLKGLIGVVATRVREICRLADSSVSAALYRRLYEQVKALMNDLGLESHVVLSTKYGMIARRFCEVMTDPGVSGEQKAVLVAESVKQILKRSWSCADLHHSVFLAPNQIRTCCKRFFRDGKMEGDVVLINVSSKPGKPLSSDEIFAAKRELHDAINRGDSTLCDGCPFLEFKEWPPLEALDIHYLSLEYHSVCNLRCSYCSDQYYGGAKPNYDVPRLVNEFLERGQLAKCAVVVWGGGEPVVDADFTSLLKTVVNRVPRAAHRVLTNSVKFSTTVATLLAEDRLSVTTSVDAGSAETFKTVRGRAKLTVVMSNLKKYAALQPRRVTVKYIFTKENSTLDDVRGFVQLAKQYDLNGCCFQISSDFKDENIPLESAVLMIAMHGLLIGSGFNVVFFDDLVRHRLGNIHGAYEAEIHERLKAIGLEGALARQQDYPRAVIWGAGWQAKYLIEKSAFFKHVKVAFLVDDTPSKIGGRFLGYEIAAPAVLLDSDIPVVIAAVQGFPAIYNSFVGLGIDKARLITGLIL